MDKQKIVRGLHDRNYIHELHSKLTEGIVGCLRDEYFMRNPTMKLETEITTAPILRALSRMLVSSFMSIAIDKLTDIIIEEVDKDLTENNHARE
jgi:hypothetical protein